LRSRTSEELDVTAGHAAEVDEDGRWEGSKRSTQFLSLFLILRANWHTIGSERVSATSSTAVSQPPSAFSSSRRNSKRIKLAQVPSNTPSGNEGLPNTPDSKATAVAGTREGSLRPSSKASKRPGSMAESSRRSVPLSAIVSPRPPSIVHSDYYGRGREGLHMRDPRKPWTSMKVGWAVHLKGKLREDAGNEKGENDEEVVPPSPKSALFFYLGFLLPLLWVIGALLHDSSLKETKRNSKWDQKTWEKSKVREKGLFSPFRSIS